MLKPKGHSPEGRQITSSMLQLIYNIYGTLKNPPKVNANSLLVYMLAGTCFDYKIYHNVDITYLHLSNVHWSDCGFIFTNMSINTWFST